MFALRCCTSYNEAREEVVGDGAGTDERLEHAAPRALRIRALVATVLHGGNGEVPQLRCACEVPGKPQAKVEGSVPSAAGPEPQQGAFEAPLPHYSMGDPLRFTLGAGDAVGQDEAAVIGEVTLQPMVFHPNGFSGELSLTSVDGSTTAYLTVGITAEGGRAFPPDAAPATGYRATIESVPGPDTDLGLDLDLMDRVYARVNGIGAGPFQSYNEKAGPSHRISVDDFIYSVNGCRWAREFVHQLRRGKTLNLLVKRPLKYTVIVDKKGGSLGLDLWYEHDASPALLVTKVNEGPVSEWNAGHPDRQLERFDRIVGVNGESGSASRLLQLIRDATQRLELSTVRPSVDGPSSGPVDISGLTRMAASDLGLLPQPEAPRARTALVQVYVRCQEFGGADKSANGHRYDTIPVANGMIASGMSCQLVHYVHQEHDQFFEVCSRFDAVIVRCNPGQIRADGGVQARFDEGMRQLRRRGLHVWPSPDVMELMGAKDALVKVAHLHIGLEDTAAYYTEAEFAAGFRKTMAFQPRVIKQNRGSAGEGIWIVKLKDGNYCKSYGERLCADGEVLTLVEANDNHEESHSVVEFIEFCVNGRTAKSGTWTSKGVGKYLDGGKAAGGQLVDQRFCPRIVEGELRYNMIGESCVGIIHKKPKEGGISAVAGTGSVYTFYGPDEERFLPLTTNFLQRDLEKVMPALGLPDEPIPLWWTADFILASPEGTPASEERWIVGEFNCSCVGISKCLAAYCTPDNPRACYSDISAEDRIEARRLGSLMGEKALRILGRAD
mmetsp:Transcript_44501/g.123746  ORF Transcript_44501/g.123746 Transcript_44501/m.123746 type:complete len:781 (-) Transcript_44501:238-2580(-)